MIGYTELFKRSLSWICTVSFLITCLLILNLELGGNEGNKNPISVEDEYFSRHRAQYLNCSAIFHNNQSLIRQYKNHGRLKISENIEDPIEMDCVSIRNRIYGDVKNFEPLKRRISFHRNIYRFYEQQEVFLSMIYHPENVYCYAIDEKSNINFKSRIRQLSSCFSNIHVLDKEFDFKSTGYLQDRGHIECLKKVAHQKWDHALLLQNDDMIIKTPYQLSELSEILKNVSLVLNLDGWDNRYDTKVKLTPASLELFKDENSVPDEILNSKIRIRGTTNQVFLSRPFIDSVFEKLNIDAIMNFFDDKRYYGTDEMLFSTLYYNYLGLDTQIQSKCTLPPEIELVRYGIWIDNNNMTACFGGEVRHSGCVFGVEYLSSLFKRPCILVNKVLQNYDFGTVICMKEMIQKGNLTPMPSQEELMKVPQYREMIQKSKRMYNPESFKC